MIVSPSPPSVLFVDHSSALGGAELYLLDVVTHYPKAHVALFEDGPFRDRLEERDVPVSVLGAGSSVLSVSRDGGLLQGIRAVPGLLRLVTRLARRARTADVLVANSQKALIVSALAGWWSNRPVVWNLHDILSTDHFHPLRIRLAVTVANLLTDHVITNSRASRDAFIAAGGAPSRTSIVYNGISATPFDTARHTNEGTNVRSELGLAPDTPLVGIFSRLAPWKGQHILLDALAGLPDVHALLVGDALFQGEHAYRQDLHDQARRLQLTDRVHFLGFRNDIPALLNAVDVVAHTSVSPEPFGRVIVEGMLAQRPVIATGMGGALDIIEDTNQGRLVPPGDVDALQTALRDLLDNPDYARNLAQTGHRRARSAFSVEAMVADLTAVVMAVDRREEQIDMLQSSLPPQPSR